MTVDAEHRAAGATDVSFSALTRFLRLPEIAGQWTAAVYICDMQATMTKAEKQESRMRVEPPSTPEARKTLTAKLTEGRAADARPFLRAGFAEAEGHLGHLYATRDMAASCPLSHVAALAVPLAMDKEEDEATLTAADKALLLAVQKGATANQRRFLPWWTSSCARAPAWKVPVLFTALPPIACPLQSSRASWTGGQR